MALEVPGTRGPASESERRHGDRRRSGRGGRRRGDRGRPWWQKGLIFAAVCAIARGWKILRRER